MSHSGARQPLVPRPSLYPFASSRCSVPTFANLQEETLIKIADVLDEVTPPFPFSLSPLLDWSAKVDCGDSLAFQNEAIVPFRRESSRYLGFFANIARGSFKESRGISFRPRSRQLIGDSCDGPVAQARIIAGGSPRMPVESIGSDSLIIDTDLGPTSRRPTAVSRSPGAASGGASGGSRPRDGEPENGECSI